MSRQGPGGGREAVERVKAARETAYGLLPSSCVVDAGGHRRIGCDLCGASGASFVYCAGCGGDRVMV